MKDRVSDTGNCALSPTVFSSPVRAWPESDKNGNYEAWTFGTVWYDGRDDNVCLVYNSRKSHTGKDGGVYFRTKKDYGPLSVAIPVALSDEIYGKRAHCAGMCPNGDYLVIAVHHFDGLSDGDPYVYRSADRGKNWLNEGKLLINGVFRQTGKLTSLFTTSKGRLLAFNRVSPGNDIEIAFSDDNGRSWKSSPLNKGSAPVPMEGSFVELSDGTVVCVIRGNFYTGDFTVKQDTYFTKSRDNGCTWSVPEKLNDIDASFNGVAMVYHDDVKAVEMIYGSRFVSDDGKGSIYRRIVDEKSFAQGKLGRELKIGSGSGDQNFGYFGACKSKNNVINVFFYDGNHEKTDIYNMVGRRPQ